MVILGIETSCDDTAVAIVRGEGEKSPRFSVLANEISSQIEVHRKYGGVYPTMAKREHTKNLVPVLLRALAQISTQHEIRNPYLAGRQAKQIPNSKIQKIRKILEREPELFEMMEKEIFAIDKPKINAIAVTEGPGLEPALWIGLNFARALAVLWDVPIIGVDHMEGHIFSNFLTEVGANSKSEARGDSTSLTIPSGIEGQIQNSPPMADQPSAEKFKIQYPALALAVSGGHTQLILIKDWMKYELLGETRDDAAGEAFDKVGKLLGLPYPGGPAVERKAAQYKSKILNPKSLPRRPASPGSQQGERASETNSKFKILNSKLKIELPRPMLHSKDYDFSFSGLKTAVLYDFQKRSEKVRKSEAYMREMSYAFQQAVIDILTFKTLHAAKEYRVHTIMLGGGVAANKALRKTMEKTVEKKLPGVMFYVPSTKLATDNAAMIAAAGYAHLSRGETSNIEKMEADSTKTIG